VKRGDHFFSPFSLRSRNNVYWGKPTAISSEFGDLTVARVTFGLAINMTSGYLCPDPAQHSKVSPTICEQVVRMYWVVSFLGWQAGDDGCKHCSACQSGSY
jgi:hypothetical protein